MQRIDRHLHESFQSCHIESFDEWHPKQNTAERLLAMKLFEVTPTAFHWYAWKRSLALMKRHPIGLKCTRNRSDCFRDVGHAHVVHFCWSRVLRSSSSNRSHLSGRLERKMLEKSTNIGWHWPTTRVSLQYEWEGLSSHQWHRCKTPFQTIESHQNKCIDVGIFARLRPSEKIFRVNETRQNCITDHLEGQNTLA